MKNIFFLNNYLLDEGQIDRTEVSMSDVIFVGGACGHHEMEYSKKVRERKGLQSETKAGYNGQHI